MKCFVFIYNAEATKLKQVGSKRQVVLRWNSVKIKLHAKSGFKQTSADLE